MSRSSSSRIELLPFQQAAIDSVHDVFGYAARQLREVQRSADRRRIIAHNGCVLLQAPTGAGKTLMAGRLAERLSREQHIVWLWFAPFAGLVDQAKTTLKAQCPGLRVLNIRLDRQLERLRSGDVFVTTWASVAASNKDSRKLRTDTEQELSLDRLAEAIHEAGFRIEKDLFNPADIRRSKAPIPLDEREIAKRAQRQLLEADELDPREVRRLLLRRLKQEYDRLGNPVADDPERLKRALNKILVLHPDIIRLASSRCYAEFSETYDTQPLPDELSFDTPQSPSDRNSYGIRPPGLNSHELEFVDLLDHDPGDTVRWWHRNEPQKPDSVALVMPSGRRYFPDFIVKVQDRQPGDGLILIEAKGPHLLNTDDTKDKLLAQHKTYRNPLMVTRESGGPDSGGAWMTLAYQERNSKVVLDRRFDVDLLATHVASVR